MFSIHDLEAQKKLQYYFTSAEIKNSKNGTKKVDGDSIWRFASVSKLFTVYAGMTTLTEEQWNTPMTKIFPQIAEFQAKHNTTNDHVDYSQWDRITPWQLASHLSGIIGKQI